MQEKMIIDGHLCVLLVFEGPVYWCFWQWNHCDVINVQN